MERGNGRGGGGEGKREGGRDRKNSETCIVRQTCLGAFSQRCFWPVVLPLLVTTQYLFDRVHHVCYGPAVFSMECGHLVADQEALTSLFRPQFFAPVCC
jgi:hypothetical protein